MKVLLVQAYLGRAEIAGPVFPIGLCYIASSLQNHEVHVFDPNISASPFFELEKRVKLIEPEVVGISLRNIDTTQKRDIFYYFKMLQPMVQLIKEIHPAAKLMVGGPGFSMFAQEIMERIPDIDVGVYLEGDESVPELLTNLGDPEGVKGIYFRKGENIIFTGERPFPDVTKLPFPRIDLFDVEKYHYPPYTGIAIQTKRGCPFKCAYCSYPFLNGTKIRKKSPEQVVDEIEYLVNRFKLNLFMFADSVFNYPESHAEGICREMIRRRLQVEWSAYFDVKGFSEELLILAMKAGCINFSFSPDAVSDASLTALGKGIREKDILDLMRMLRKKCRVRVEFHFFCTPPKQNILGFLKTLLIFLKTNLLFMGKGVVNLGWIRIEPRTKIYRMAIEENVISKETKLLPMEEKELSGLFYSCPVTKAYADPVFNLLLNLTDRVKPFVKKYLIRKKGMKQ
jgi:anaerobic magnesium-protoporphyrin IX monomethyl ester cyclase